MTVATSLAPKFRPAEWFQQGTTYQLLPFRFLEFDDARMILVNEAGEHQFLDRATFRRFIERKLSTNETAYHNLKGKHFLADSDSSIPVHLLAAKVRTKKAFLAGFTRLHIFVVTLRCEHSCHYCQVSRVTSDKVRYDMTPETALHALDLVFRSPAQDLKIEFQGGESLLNFEIITLITQEAERRATKEGRRIEFVIATNLALVTEQILAFCRDHQIFLSVSLDGPAFIHNANRPRPGNNSYELTIENLGWARAILGHDRVSAIMTTTRKSLPHSQQIVDEYRRQGFRAIFLRPISPYGFAIRTKQRTDCSTDEFLRFYVEALDHILALNLAGTRFVEVYAQILLTRIFTPYATGYVDLQSPSGAAISVAVYNYDGDVYATDESRMLAKMGDDRFRLGNVHSDSYEHIFLGPLAKGLALASINESLPGCADCAFQSYCGADPVFNWATQGDVEGHRPSSNFHRRNFFLIRHLIERYYASPTARRVFSSWISDFDASIAPSGQAE